MDNYVLLMPFLDESANFSNGFAMGQLWEKMSNNEEFENHSVRQENGEQVELMANHFGYNFSLTEYDEEWLLFTGKPIDISKLNTL